MSKRRKTSKPNVFISHSHLDRHSAVDLQSILIENGSDTYLDQDQIQVADNLPERIRQGINKCDTFLLLWSASAASSSWVGREWDMAYDLRKKIIPYVFDRTPLPPALENLVYVNAKDQMHGNAQLLKAVLGRDFKPNSTKLFPGRWQATVDAYGAVQGSYDLELRSNGQVEGEGGISNSGIAGQIAGEMSMQDLLSMRIPVHGSWSYEQKTKILTIEMSASAFGQQQDDTIRIRATGHEAGSIRGKDLGGRDWTFRRVDDGISMASIDAERQKIREAMQKVVDTDRDSPTLWLVLTALCMGYHQEGKYDLGLPIEKATKVTKAMKQSEGKEWQAAVEDFLRQLQLDGWIK